MEKQRRRSTKLGMGEQGREGGGAHIFFFIIFFIKSAVYLSYFFCLFFFLLKLENHRLSSKGENLFELKNDLVATRRPILLDLVSLLKGKGDGGFRAKFFSQTRKPSFKLERGKPIQT